MSLRPVANMFVKLLGLYTGLQSLNALPVVWNPLLRLINCSFQGGNYLDLQPTWTSVLPGLLVGLAQIAVGSLLWRYSPQLSSAITSEEEESLSQNHENWQRVALGLGGAYLVADSICGLVAALVIFINQPSYDARAWVTPIVAMSVVRAVVGFWFWGGARNIVRIIRDARRDGEMSESV